MSTYPPDGYAIYNGTWGTDADIDTAVRLTGSQSVKFKNTQPANDPQLITDVYPCSPSEPLAVGAWLRSGSVASGRTLGVYVQFYDSSMTYLGGLTIFNGLLKAANTWELKSGIVTPIATSAFFLVSVVKTKANVFEAWVDSVFVKKYPSCFSAYLSASTSYTTGSKIVFDATSFNHGSMYNTTTGDATIPADGIYSVVASARILLLDLNEYFSITMNLKPYGSTESAKAIGTTLHSYVNDTSYSNSFAWIGFLAQGDLINMRFNHGHATGLQAQGVTGITQPTMFAVTQLMAV